MRWLTRKTATMRTEGEASKAGDMVAAAEAEGSARVLFRVGVSGMVRANVGHEVMLITLSKGYFCTNFYVRWSCDVMSPSTTTQTTNQHHHHGDGAAHLSSGKDLMIPRRPRGGQPCTFIF
jgi:hypothetical protein